MAIQLEYQALYHYQKGFNIIVKLQSSNILGIIIKLLFNLLINFLPLHANYTRVY